MVDRGLDAASLISETLQLEAQVRELSPQRLQMQPRLHPNIPVILQPILGESQQTDLASQCSAL